MAGNDCTIEFDDIGHSNSAHNTLENYLIGQVLDKGKDESSIDNETLVESSELIERIKSLFGI